MEQWFLWSKTAPTAETTASVGDHNPWFLANIRLATCYLVLQYWWLVHQSVNCCWYWHMGLSGINIRKYFVHQNKFVFPVILYHWETYRAALIQQLQKVKNTVWSGDGHFDSMGHCAKFGVYTLFLLHNYERCTLWTSSGKTWYVSLIMGMFGRNVPNMPKLYMYVELVPVCQPLRLYISILPCT